jgi:hypothetical protein
MFSHCVRKACGERRAWPAALRHQTLLECTLWVRQQNERRKGRKGRKPPARIRRVGFVNDISNLDVRCGGRFAPLGVAETGANWRILPAETLLEKLSAILLSHPRGAVQSSASPSLAEIAEITKGAISQFPRAPIRYARIPGRPGAPTRNIVSHGF